MIRVKILNNYLGPYPSDLSLHVFNLNFHYENHFYSFLVKHKCKASTIKLRAAQAGNHFPVRWLIFGSSTYRSKESLESQFLWKSIFQGHSRSPKVVFHDFLSRVDFGIGIFISVEIKNLAGKFAGSEFLFWDSGFFGKFEILNPGFSENSRISGDPGALYPQQDHSDLKIQKKKCLIFTMIFQYYLRVC